MVEAAAISVAVARVNKTRLSVATSFFDIISSSDTCTKRCTRRRKPASIDVAVKSTMILKYKSKAVECCNLIILLLVAPNHTVSLSRETAHDTVD
jgi:hypothetical protein